MKYINVDLDKKINTREKYINQCVHANKEFGLLRDIILIIIIIPVKTIMTKHTPVPETPVDSTQVVSYNTLE